MTSPSIAVTSVNDTFVMQAWKRDTDLKNQVEFLADGSADFAKAVGLDADFSAGGMGVGRPGWRTTMCFNTVTAPANVVARKNTQPTPTHRNVRAARQAVPGGVCSTRSSAGLSLQNAWKPR